MSSKKIYQQFIRKTASEGKSIVAWDASRRYEGVFKQFDPTGEFVILTNVWVSEGQETIFVSEMLLPLDNLTIVSAGLPIETFEEETYEEFGAVYPAEISPETRVPSVSQPTMEGDTAFTFSQAESFEEPAYQVEESKEPKPETSPSVESALSKLINLPTVSSEKPTEPAASEPPVASQPMVVPTAPSETSKLEKLAPAAVESETTAEQKAKTTSSEIKEPEEKEGETLEEKTAPIQKVKAGFGKLPGFFNKVFKKKPMQEHPQNLARKIPPTPAYRYSQPKHIFPPVPPKPTAPVAPSPTTHPQVIQRRSAQVSTSSFFAQPVPSQAAIPKQKVDIGTLILDILIGILTLVVIAIVAMGFLGIKIPSLPF